MPRAPKDCFEVVYPSEAERFPSEFFVPVFERKARDKFSYDSNGIVASEGYNRVTRVRVISCV